ncbi:MAG: Ribbon-helix-helix protein, copG family [Candidatus Scalindua rubra]|uniref:Ribbon-helix-helix protein, copG family n=1 Tax=Candidatus Scalindua rubra TaxID=1872076 RepID=A0A1E3X5R6_9BACT|nr:MAG: Ribbon-helix-helix protein, copG family [Candidatus Scalindua rubra]
MITLRLSSELEKDIENIAKSAGITKSELVRKSLIEYVSKYQFKNAWDLGKDLFGKYKSGKTNLSTSSHTIFREKLRKKDYLAI